MPSNATWVAYCRQKTTCLSEDCESPEIPAGSSVVRGRVKGNLVTWHPQCWLDSAMEVLLATSYKASKAGRKALDISDEQRAARLKILSRHAAYAQRIRRYQRRQMEATEPSGVISLRIQALQKHQDILWWKILDLGGPPDSWQVPEGGDIYLAERAQERSRNTSQAQVPESS